MKSIRLLCLPFAGGSAASFTPFRRHLDNQIEMVALELAGRGRRLRENNYESLDDAVEEAHRLVLPRLNEGSYVLWGHSMGAKITYELAHRIQEFGQPEPILIILTGISAAQIPRYKGEILHTLPEPEFKTRLLEMGGTPREFFEHPELLELFLPLLRRDFKNTETYIHPQRDSKLETEILVINGENDIITGENQGDWSTHSVKPCRIEHLPGGHFFIYQQIGPLSGIISTAILKAASFYEEPRS